MPLQCILEPILHFPTIVEIFHRLPSRKTPQFLRGRYPKRILSRKRYHFLHRTGYLQPDEQKNAPNPAQKVHGNIWSRKRYHFSARKRIPTACRAGKCPNSGAEGAPRQLRAEKGGKSCAEQDTHRLPRRKTPQIQRGRYSGAVPGRKKGDFLK